MTTPTIDWDRLMSDLLTMRYILKEKRGCSEHSNGIISVDSVWNIALHEKKLQANKEQAS